MSASAAPSRMRSTWISSSRTSSTDRRSPRPGRSRPRRPPSSRGNKPPYPFDKKKSEALLDEAGYKRGADGNRFSLKLVPIMNGEDVPLLATFIQQSLADVGIKVEIVQLDIAGALTTVYRDWNFDLATRLAPVSRRSGRLDDGLVPLRLARRARRGPTSGAGSPTRSTSSSTRRRARSIRSSARRSMPIG